MFRKASLLFLTFQAVALVSAQDIIDPASYNIKDHGFRLGHTVPKSILAHKGEAHDRLVSAYTRHNETGALSPIDIDGVYNGYYSPNATEHEKRQFEALISGVLELFGSSSIIQWSTKIGISAGVLGAGFYALGLAAAQWKSVFVDSSGNTVSSETGGTDKLNGQRRRWGIAPPATSFKRVNLQEQDDVPSVECGLGKYIDNEDQSISDSDSHTIGNDIANDVVNNNIYDGSYQLVDSNDIVSEWGFTCNTDQAGATTSGARRRTPAGSFDTPPAYKRDASPTVPDTSEAKFRRLQRDVAESLERRSLTDTASIKRDIISYALVCPSDSGVTSIECGEVGCRCSQGGAYSGCDTGYPSGETCQSKCYCEAI